MYDVIIIGAGPAGLSAAIYTARKNLSTLVLAKSLGGQMAETDNIENYPGFELISGLELADKFQKQAEKVGVKFTYQEVRDIRVEAGKFLVKIDSEELEAKTIILSFGLIHRGLNVPGEQEFRGKGVTYCATCDAPLYRNKITAVVGGGNAAFEAVMSLADIGKKVYLIHRRDAFRGDETLVDRIKKNNKVEILFNSEIIEIKGDKVVNSILVKNNQTGETKEVAVQGVFIEIGNKVSDDFVKDLVKLDEKGQIMVDRSGRTSQPGVFAAGDLTDTEYKQIVIAAGEGAKAALAAYHYIKTEK